jgi:magnesium chelatase family protein
MEKARERQQKRFAGSPLLCNGDMGPAEVRRYCVLEDMGKNLLRRAMQQMSQILGDPAIPSGAPSVRAR